MAFWKTSDYCRYKNRTFFGSVGVDVVNAITQIGFMIRMEGALDLLESINKGNSSAAEIGAVSFD